MTQSLDDFLPADPADPGCDAGIPILDEYVEIELAGGDPADQFPGTAAHLRACPGCRADHDGLLEAARLFAGSAPPSLDELG
jgi:hypothetical protein